MLFNATFSSLKIPKTTCSVVSDTRNGYSGSGLTCVAESVSVTCRSVGSGYLSEP